MKKTSFVLALSLLISVVFMCVCGLSVSARPPLVVDDEGLLTDTQVSELIAKLEEISARREMDIVIVTTPSFGGKSAQDYADDYFDYNGYGQGSDRDGILLLFSAGEWYYHISTSGEAIYCFTDIDLEELEDLFIGLLRGKEFYKAFNSFADGCDRRIDEYHKELVAGSVVYAVVSLLIGMLFAAIKGSKYKKELISVVAKGNADDYIAPKGLNITSKSDVFLTSSVSKTYISTSSGGGGGSSTHTSSSGRTHGGRGGRL